LDETRAGIAWLLTFAGVKS